jgi:hypothetical protein
MTKTSTEYYQLSKKRKSICKHCGKDFLTSIWDKTIYCSRKCFGLSQRCLPKECLQCGKTFVPSQNSVKRCSKECDYKSRRGRQREKVKIEKECCVCGKKIFVIPYYKDMNKTCSKKCIRIFRSKPLSTETKLKISISHRGSKAYNWKGTTPKEKLERVKFQKTIQKSVFERDNYTCQMCGLKGINLQVDHIQSWKDYVELRFDISNCRTLCAECHYKITFGRPMPSEIKGWGHHLLERERIVT